MCSLVCYLDALVGSWLFGSKCTFSCWFTLWKSATSQFLHSSHGLHLLLLALPARSPPASILEHSCRLNILPRPVCLQLKVRSNLTTCDYYPFLFGNLANFQSLPVILSELRLPCSSITFVKNFPY